MTPWVAAPHSARGIWVPDALASQAEAAAEDCGADAWSAVTAGAVTAAEYWQAVQSDLDDESEAYREGYCQAEEERERERENPNGHWLDRLRELVGLPPRRR